jgi:hypothetical protein
VPFYDGRWNVEVYNVKSQMEFPCDDASTPMDHIPARSQVACVLQCGGIWIGGKGWGLTWKLFQCVVKKNPQSVALKGICNVHLSPEDMEEQGGETARAPDTPRPVIEPAAAKPKHAAPTPVEAAQVEDSVSEDAAEPEPEQVKVAAAPVLEPEPEPVAAPVKKVVKKVVKKAA